MFPLTPFPPYQLQLPNQKGSTMLRSLYSGISGLSAHQKMLDVTGNNIANVNTTGFKSSAVQFQDTLSQLVSDGSGPTGQIGGRNPAQIGLGVQLAGISTNFTQGSTQSTGKGTDLMISGDGFFVTSKAGDTMYTRSGAFSLDQAGNLVSSDGAFVQGWGAVNGVIQNGGPTSNIVLSGQTLAPAAATTAAVMAGNLPAEAAAGDQFVREIEVYDAAGAASSLSVTFTRTAAGWDTSAALAGGATATGAMTFTNGVLTGGGTLNVGGIGIDLSTVTGYTGMNTIAAKSQNGSAAGTLESFSIGADGTITGSFSNGAKIAVAQLAMATFDNPGGLEKAGNTSYAASVNSGNAIIGTGGSAGFGTMSSGSLEMSNVDLSQEFTNLIIAQRGFQANSRIITTSDSVLEELVNLKR